MVTSDVRVGPPTAVLAVLLALSACAAQTAAPPPPAAAATVPTGGSVGTPSSFDGTYAGAPGTPTNRSGGSGHISCPVVNRASIRVVNGVASMRFNGLFNGPVGPDGSLSISGSNGGSVSGKFSGSSFTGTVNSPNCSYALPSLTKS